MAAKRSARNRRRARLRAKTAKPSRGVDVAARTRGAAPTAGTATAPPTSHPTSHHRHQQPTRQPRNQPYPLERDVKTRWSGVLLAKRLKPIDKDADNHLPPVARLVEDVGGERGSHARVQRENHRIR